MARCLDDEENPANLKEEHALSDFLNEFFADILWEELGSKAELIRCFFHDVLGEDLRGVVGEVDYIDARNHEEVYLILLKFISSHLDSLFTFEFIISRLHFLCLF